MLTVYDRVVAGGGLSTLLLSQSHGLALVARRFRMGTRDDSVIAIAWSCFSERISDATFKRALLTGAPCLTAALSDLTALRQFMTGNGIFAFFDAPWFPVYVGVMFLFHPWFGVAGILAGIAMVVLAIANESSTNKLLTEANAEAANAANKFQGSLRNAEVVAGMGMAEDLRRIQDAAYRKVSEKQTDASQRHNYGVAFPNFRMIVQSTVRAEGVFSTQPTNLARDDDCWFAPVGRTPLHGCARRFWEGFSLRGHSMRYRIFSIKFCKP